MRALPLLLLFSRPHGTSIPFVRLLPRRAARLQHLELRDNSIRSISGHHNPVSLQTMDLSENRLFVLNATGFDALRVLCLNRNALVSLDGLNAPKLECLVVVRRACVFVSSPPFPSPLLVHLVLFFRHSENHNNNNDRTTTPSSR